MATDLEKLVVQLSADINKFEKEMVRARGVSNREFNAIEKRARQLNRNLDNVTRGFGRSLTAPLAGIAAGLGVAEVIKYADAWKRAGNSLKVAGVPADALGGTLDRLFNIAQNAGTDLGSTVTLFSRLSQTAKELGANQEQLFQFTEGVGDALKVAGTDAQSASGALLQLSQALGSAVVRAEEFNSINEGARPILQAVADGMEEAGGSVSKLRTLVLAGSVTNKQFFDAFLKGSASLKQQAAQASTTFGQAFQKISNAFTKYIGQTDEGLDASQRLIQGLEALADNFDATADTAIAFASILAAGLLGRSIGKMIAQIGLAGAALINFMRTLRAAQAVARGGLLLGGLSSAAGPIGAAIGIAAAAALYFASRADDAGESSETAAQKADRYAAALKRVKGAAEGAGEAVAKSGKKFVETETFRLAQQVEGDAEEYKKTATEVRKAAQDALDRLNDVKDEFGNDPAFQAQVRALETLRDSLDGTAQGGVKAQEALNSLANSDPGFQNLANKLNPLLDKLIGIGEAVRAAKSDLTSLASGISGISDDERGRFRAEQGQTRDVAAFRAGLETDASRTDAQRQLDAKTKEVMEQAEKAGHAMTEAAARIEAASLIAKENAAKGLDNAISSFVDHVVNAESGGDANAKNPRSSATGLGQFIESTWLRLFRENFPDRARSMTDATILALRSDAETSRQLIEAYARENAGILQKAGVSVNEAALQLAHFLGPQGAINVLKAAPGTPVSQVLSPAAIKANPEILGGGATVDDVRGYAERRAGMNTVLARENELREQQRNIIREMLQDGAEETARIQLETSLIGASNAEREKETFIFERLNELKRQGIKLTPEILKSVEDEANARYGAVQAYDAASEAADRLREKQEDLAQVQEEIGSAFQGALKGFISDLVHGKSATEALGDALARLGDRLLDIALDQIFKSFFGGAGGLGAGIFSLLGFDQGGYTGMGGKYEPAGIVHRGEYVMPKEAVDRIGIGPLEAMRKGRLPGYASGGYVLPKVSSGYSQASAPAQQPAPVYNVTKVVNTFDAGSFISEGLNSPAGEKSILNFVRARPGAFKAAMGIA